MPRRPCKRAYPTMWWYSFPTPGHYCAHNIVGWLGIGTDQLIVIPTIAENEIDLAQLADAARGTALDSGKKIAAIIATMGTTDAFGLGRLAGRLRPCATRSSMSSNSPTARTSTPTRSLAGRGRCFNDYDFSGTIPLEFRPRTPARPRRRVPPHSPSGVGRFYGHRLPQDRLCPVYLQPLPRQRPGRFAASDARPANRWPYLYHFWRPPPRHVHPRNVLGPGTGPLAALANFRFFGEQGMRVALGHHCRDDPAFARAPRRTRSHHCAQPRQLLAR